MSRLRELLRPDLRGKTAYGAPQLDVAVRLNTNENSYPVPDDVVRDITAAVAEVAPHLNRYPDREFTELRTALAGYLSSTSGVEVTPEEVWAGNGSNEVLQHILQAFGGPGRTALGFTPAYSMHPIISETVGTRWVDGERGIGADAPFDLTVESAVAQVREHQPNVVFLCSPNNPTGTALSLELVEAVHDAATDAVVVVDEAYEEFAREGVPSALTLLEGRERLVVTRTMSKAFAFAGGRLGYLAAAPALTDMLRLVRLPYHLSTPTQAIALAALRHAPEMLSTVAVIKRQRDRIVDGLRELGLDPVPSDANFVFFGGLPDSAAAWQALLDRGVLVRDVGIPHYLRVTAGTPAETDAFLAAMAEVVPELLSSAGTAGDPTPANVPGHETVPATAQERPA
ncbi:histidinol-phosphate transaminase [Knoellia sp. 3-2P3]|uniref:histidinol-phosphate transaminase n=1 Tax=unclassified Knoellia TaxID=2618719 RepID=UPI0023DA03BF|nr:histidinol-phosphate transaminase [Knoellia sp. 3-2P3]MDF2094159.1 histidinol-phosphate transaminase [Knoellia sp. 3-2P3]